VNLDISVLPIIQTRPPETGLVELEAEGLNQVQPGAGVRAKSYDIARVRGNLGLIKNHVKHGWIVSADRSEGAI
jgi:hypothetical protein